MSDDFNSDVLSGMTLSRLYELARERDIKNPRKYKKQELVDLILAESPRPAPRQATIEREPQEYRGGSGNDDGAQPAFAEPAARREQSAANSTDYDLPSRQNDESDYIEDEPSGFAPAQSGNAMRGGRNDVRRDKRDQGRDGGRDNRRPMREQSDSSNRYPSSNIQDGRGGKVRNNRQDRQERPDRQDRQDRQLRNDGRRGRDKVQGGLSNSASRDLENAEITTGILEIIEDANYGFIRQKQFGYGEQDIYVSMSQIKKFNMRTGDLVEGYARSPREQERYQSLVKIESINGEPFDADSERINFSKLTPIYPKHRLLLETTSKEVSTRLIDLFSPIGKGSRGIIAARPKAGKTIMLKKIADAIAHNHPDVELIALLIDERPEEVTDFERNIKGQVISSTFDEKPENHIQTAELVIEYAKRRVEQGKDVMVLLDSLTRLARAYNLTCAPSGKTLSGGLDPNSLYKPKRFLGAARNIENGGSLTLLCTALVETGSRLDDIIFEEFKGTANMELHLSRELADKRIFPSIDVVKSGTRHEELLYKIDEMEIVWKLRKMVADMDEAERMSRLITRLLQTSTNAELLMMIHAATT
ncbi:MAG: transcription termination factor Rho [Planctomycetales bacterium]|nr:transcription termination factor Rho [bacterium]UNM09542.1 MAG: transcription termination factor Rho [Planctomycetales bacterium]